MPYRWNLSIVLAIAERIYQFEIRRKARGQNQIVYKFVIETFSYILLFFHNTETNLKFVSKNINLLCTSLAYHAAGAKRMY